MQKVQGIVSRDRYFFSKFKHWCRITGGFLYAFSVTKSPLSGLLVSIFKEASYNFEFDSFINKETSNCKNHQRMFRKYLFNIISLQKKIFISWYNPFKVKHFKKVHTLFCNFIWKNCIKTELRNNIFIRYYVLSVPVKVSCTCAR